MTQPSGRLAASRRAQRSKTVVGHHSQFVPEHTHWPATTTNEKTVVRHSLGLWFRYSGRLPKPVWRSPIARHTRSAFAAAVQGLPHLRGAGHQHGARDLVGFETRGVEGQPQKSSMRRMTRSGFATSASYCALPSIRRGQQEHAAHARSSASNCRASPRCVPSSASVWRELKATPRFSPPPSGGRPEEGWGRWSHRLPHPHWHVRSLGGKGCYVLINCRRSRSSPSAVACAPRSCRNGCRG